MAFSTYEEDQSPRVAILAVGCLAGVLFRSWDCSVPILKLEFLPRDNLKLHLSLAEILSLRVKYLVREAIRPQSVVPGILTA